jgi:hypothetical protein
MKLYIGFGRQRMQGDTFDQLPHDYLAIDEIQHGDVGINRRHPFEPGQRQIALLIAITGLSTRADQSAYASVFQQMEHAAFVDARVNGYDGQVPGVLGVPRVKQFVGKTTV